MIAPANKQACARQEGVIELLGSVVAALSIAIALIMDHFRGWGDSRRSVLNVAVVQVMAPILAVWILVALMEYAHGRHSMPLLVVRCVSAIAPAVTFTFLDRQGHLLSLWASAQLSASTALTERSVGHGIVVLATMMAIAGCTHAVWRWFCAQQVR